MSDYKNYLLELEALLSGLLEDMTNKQALDEIEKTRGSVARTQAEGIFAQWQKNMSMPINVLTC